MAIDAKVRHCCRYVTGGLPPPWKPPPPPPPRADATSGASTPSAAVAQGILSWSRKFGQDDKWNFCQDAAPGSAWTLRHGHH
jgi:hypothetical protein